MSAWSSWGLGVGLLLAAGLARGTEPVPVPEDPPPAARSAYDRGIAALKAKDPATARAALEECLRVAPASLACRWELGWAAWQAADWDGAVAAWDKVAAIDATYQSIETALPQARNQRDLARTASDARSGAPATIAPPAPGSPRAPAVRLRAVGDMMIGTAFPEGVLPPDGGAGAFASVRSLLQDADVTIGNLEGPLCDTTKASDKCANASSPGSCYAFRSPTGYGRHYKDAGFDVLSTANNHAGDFGDECRTQTEQTLDAQGIRWSGRAGTTTEWTTNGRRVGFAAFHTNAVCNDVNDFPAATALISALAGRSDIVVVMFHGGAEGSKAIHVPNGPEQFYGENRGDLRAFARVLIDAGADLVIGAGPHVLRGMEMYKDRLVAYSLGNFATYGRFNLNGNQGLGAILEVQLAADGRFSAAKLLGIRQVGEGIPQPDAANAGVDLIRTLTISDFPGTGVVIAQDGTIGAPR